MKKNGFTFIEILVVVAIIGLLSGIGLTSYTTANKKARDGKRRADIEQIRSALEMYKADNSTYPASLNDLASYISPLPSPPTAIETYEYSYLTNTTYQICFDLEIADSSCSNPCCKKQP